MSLRLPGHRVGGGLHHVEPARRMDIDDGRPRIEPQQGAQALGHGVGNVMQLEVEEDGHPGLCHAGISRSPMRVEELHAELDVADAGPQLAR